MITARIKGADRRECSTFSTADYFVDLVWEDEQVDAYDGVNLAVSLQPFTDQVAVASGKRYKESWAGVPSCVFLEIVGRYCREGKLLDIYFDYERPNDEPYR